MLKSSYYLILLLMNNDQVKTCYVSQNGIISSENYVLGDDRTGPYPFDGTISFFTDH